MKKNSLANTLLTVVLTLLSFAWVYPVVMILLNSLKQENAISTNTAFQLPTAETFAGLTNYINALGSKGFAAAFFSGSAAQTTPPNAASASRISTFSFMA